MMKTTPRHQARRLAQRPMGRADLVVHVVNHVVNHSPPSRISAWSGVAFFAGAGERSRRAASSEAARVPSCKSWRRTPPLLCAVVSSTENRRGAAASGTAGAGPVATVRVRGQPNRRACVPGIVARCASACFTRLRTYLDIHSYAGFEL